MDITLRGLLLVLFRVPFMINIGFGPGLVPAIQLRAGTANLLWNGYEPFGVLTGESDSFPFPFFMLGFTTAKMVFTANGVEGEMRSDGLVIGDDEDDRGKS